MDKYIFAIVGGDKRNLYLAKLLEKDGHIVKLFGFSKYSEEKIYNITNLEKVIKDADYIITATPLTCDNITLTSFYDDKETNIIDLFNLINIKQQLIGGYISKEIIDLAKNNGVNIIDMLEREELNLLNAIPTAEGAIKIAIEETEITLNGNNVMVIGYGRIGKILSKMLDGIGSNIYVVVNKSSSFAEAKSYGYNPIMYENLNDNLSNMNVIFNTVPETILDKNNINYLNKNCLVIDLSSPPFGIEYDACKQNNIKSLWARSLPGRIAPKTVAIYIKETIYNIIKENGGKYCGS